MRLKNPRLPNKAASSLAAPGPVVLPAGPEHLEGIVALANVVWWAHYPGIISEAQIDYMLRQMYDLEVMRQELRDGLRYDRLLINGQLKAFAAYGPCQPHVMKLHKLYVHPECHRQGYGSQLLQHVEYQCRQAGFAQLLLNVNKGNTKAIAAYHKNGFVIREAVTVDIGHGFVMDDFVMVKEL